MRPLNNIFQVSEQSQPDEETTETSVWKVVGPLNSTVLPQNILKFCETFPVFEIEVLENTTLPEKSGKKNTQYVTTESNMGKM